MNQMHHDDWQKGLRRRILSASGWTIASNFVSQSMRLASNLVLSRLLFPEAFGMLALVSAIMAGVAMFTDLGIGPSIIRNRQPTRRFTDTLWSLQVLRGWGLWIICLGLAYPFARWYGEPMLVYLIPAVTFMSVIQAYAHTSQFSLNRELRLRRLFALDIGTQLIGLTISMFAAYEMRNVWSLVIGNLAGALIRSVLTYSLTAEPRHHWCWDREVLKDIRNFSSWIMLSTMLTYFTDRGNILILGSFASMASLGQFSIANNIAGIAVQFVGLVAEKVLFPLYVQVGAETTHLLKIRVAKIRLTLMSIVLPPLWILICFGDRLVALLWDPRYHGAGYMVQILAAGNLFLVFGAGPLYLARGESWVGAVYQAVEIAVLLPAMIVAGHLYGIAGLICGIALSKITCYPLEVWAQRRYGIWLPWLDAVAFGASTAFITLGLMLRPYLRF